MMNYLYSAPMQIILRSNYSAVDLSGQNFKDKTNVVGSDTSEKYNCLLFLLFGKCKFARFSLQIKTNASDI